MFCICALVLIILMQDHLLSFCQWNFKLFFVTNPTFLRSQTRILSLHEVLGSKGNMLPSSHGWNNLNLRALCWHEKKMPTYFDLTYWAVWNFLNRRHFQPLLQKLAYEHYVTVTLLGGLKLAQTSNRCHPLV